MSIESKFLSVKYAYSLLRFSKSIPKHITITDSSYEGLDSTELPMKVIKGKRQLGRTIILYPGASPFAEDHPSMIFLGAVLANIGFNVFIPRIPLLKDLDISEDNIKWFRNAYEQLIQRNDVKNSVITCMGVSYGGALLLKSSLHGPMVKVPPRCLLTYGTIFDVETSLDFVMTGKLNIKGKEVNIKPHEWGMVVCFHNFLPKIDIGYDTKDIQRILKLRVQNKHEDVQSELEKLESNKKELVADILDAKISPEVKRIIDIILNEKIDLLNSIAPKSWCKDIDAKVFIMHGAGDNMVPYTQSILLSKNIPESELFISYLYEHNEISPKRSFIYKLNELKRLIKYINSFVEYHEN